MQFACNGDVKQDVMMCDVLVKQVVTRKFCMLLAWLAISQLIRCFDI